MEALGQFLTKYVCASDNEILDKNTVSDRKALEVSLRSASVYLLDTESDFQPVEDSKSCTERQNLPLYPLVTDPSEPLFHSGYRARELRLRREITFRGQGGEEAQSVDQSLWRLWHHRNQLSLDSSL